jgi:2'-5' RNA ligase
MRLFIALELPEAVRAELAAVQGRLPGGSIRWVRAGGMHLTLQFLGEADGGVVEPLIAGLAAIPREPLRLRLDGLGTFGGRAPRVVWAGVGGDSGALMRLQAAVVAATAPLGFAAEARPWSPHLTLGRARQDARPDALRALADAVRSAPPPAPLEWDAGGPVLFESKLGPGGAAYTALGPAAGS